MTPSSWRSSSWWPSEGWLSASSRAASSPRSRIKAAQDKAGRIVAEARAQQKELILQAKEEQVRLQRELDEEGRAKRADLADLERRLLQRDEQLDQRTRHARGARPQAASVREQELDVAARRSSPRPARSRSRPSSASARCRPRRPSPSSSSRSARTPSTTPCASRAPSSARPARTPRTRRATSSSPPSSASWSTTPPR